MGSNGTGGNLGGEAQRRGSGGLSVLVAAVACLIALTISSGLKPPPGHAEQPGDTNPPRL